MEKGPSTESAGLARLNGSTTAILGQRRDGGNSVTKP